MGGRGEYAGVHGGHQERPYVSGERAGEAHDNGLSKVIAIYSAPGGLTTN